MNRILLLAPGCLLACLALIALPASAAQDFYDRTHWSEVFGEYRHYRILLPRDYETSGKQYPVIYYFHGHSSRFMGERYDASGQTFLPGMIDYVRGHDVIVVRWDGFVEDQYEDHWGGSPYDIMEGGPMDFGPYFLELVAHIDSSYRTLTDRQHRATCGLSMGGFMSLFVSGRYPQLVGSASSYDPGHEFFVGPVGAKSLYFLANHVINHGRARVRLIKTSGDYIGQYHDELRDIYSRTPEVDFEFRQDEFNRHYVTNIAETFDFHLQAFEDVALDAYPERFDHDNAYEKFSVWGYDVAVEHKQAGYVCLRDVSRNYLRVTTRAYDPDGPPVEGQLIRITTPDWYGSGREYRVMDFSHREGRARWLTLRSSREGRLTFEVDGLGHELSILNGKEGRPPALLPPAENRRLLVHPDRELHLPLRLVNTLDLTPKNVQVSLSSEYPTVRIEGGTVTLDSVAPGAVVDLSDRFTQRFVSTSGELQHCRLELTVSYAGWKSRTYRIDVQVLPTPLPEAAELLVFDGRRQELPVFRQKGNQGGGFIYQRAVEEGTGNGNGRIDPGEEVTLWVKIPQGLDPLDKGTWRRAWVFGEDSSLVAREDLAEQKELEWTGVRDHTSLIRISPNCPLGRRLELVLKNESFSYVWKPDQRYGRELLYQAIQMHRDHLSRCALTVGGN